MNDKTSKTAFNKPGNIADKTAVPGHHELEEKFRNYKDVTQDAKHRAQIDKYRNNYLDAKTKQDAKAGVENKYFKDGVSLGVNTEKGRKGMEQNQQYRQEQIRKSSWKDAKNYYAENYSLQKDFSEKAHDKNKEMEKGR